VQPYTPKSLPIKNLDKATLFTAVGEANAALARYDGLLMGMVNPAIAPLCQDNYLLTDGWRRNISWRAATIAMG